MSTVEQQPDQRSVEESVATPEDEKRIQSMAAREVRLLTCDTGQHTRGRAAGLEVTKISANPGPEPDWAAQDKPGSGTRQKRRERLAAQAAAQPPATKATDG